MPEEQSLSIEETNKLRISLGLKPLTVDRAPSDVTKTGAEETEETGYEAEEQRAITNWQKHQDELEKKAFRERQKEEIKKAKEQAKRFAQLEGKGLADEDGADEDAVEWVRKMKKRQKKLAKKMAEELAARDAAAEKLEYTAEDVKSLRVAHEQTEFEEGGEMILTLKDATIDELEEEGDELENIQLGERERLKEKLELKKKKPAYNAYEDDLDENGEKRLLAQYDDEEDPKKRKKKFVLAEFVDTPEAEQVRREEVKEKLKMKPISLEIERDKTEPNDYLDPSALKIKKHKKKDRSTRKKNDGEDTLAPPPPEIPDLNAMELDETPAPSVPRPAKRNLDDINFVDDEELQTSLALQRRTALKKRKILKPEDIARQLREESAGVNGTSNGEGSPDGAIKQEEEEEPGLVIDETTEFVSNLRAPTIPDRRRKRSVSEKPAITSMEDADSDVDMDRKQPSLTPEPSSADASAPAAPPEITSTGLESEHVLSRGIGATLAMLNQRGLLERNPDSAKLLELQRERERFQMEKRLKQIEAEKRARMQREQDRKSGIFDKMSAKEREEYARWENKQRDQQEAKEMAARFKDYKPNIRLSYKDEFGREMSQKEAFKYLSHQFHGKGSGKAKTEKRLKKIEDEKKREAASTLQSATEGLTSSMADKAKKSKQAGVRLM